MIGYLPRAINIMSKEIVATPHIAHNSDITDRVGGEMVINNIEAWLKGKPVNLVE